jgi:hypothetical protein
MMRYSTFNHLDLKIFDMKPLIEIINTDNEPNIIEQIMTHQDYIKTEKWFAWHPVKTDNKGWVWLNFVNRTIDERPLVYLGLHAEYSYTNKPMQQQINYCDIKALGFTAEDGHDQVFENVHGYPYTIFTKMLTPTLMLDWRQTTRLCELLVIRHEDGHIFERIPIVDLAHLQAIVDAFAQR